MENYIDRLVSYRKNEKLSQEDIASRLGVSVFTVSRWERGHKPSRLAKARIKEYIDKNLN